LLGHGVDNILQKQIECEADKWKAILRRFLDVTLFLGSRRLAFQGDNSTIGDVHNGNFWGILELLGKYNKITREHLSTVKKHKLKVIHLKAVRITYHGKVKMSLCLCVVIKFWKLF